MKTGAFEEGKKAFKQGKRIIDCPYDPFGYETDKAHFNDWNDGWMEGDYEDFNRQQIIDTMTEFSHTSFF